MRFTVHTVWLKKCATVEGNRFVYEKLESVVDSYNTLMFVYDDNDKETTQ